MAGPLHEDDFRFPFVEAELEENRGKTIAYQAPLEDPIRKHPLASKPKYFERISPERHWPEGGDSRLHRAAERIGGAIGSAVSRAQRVPDSARQRVHLVRDRGRRARKTTEDRISNSASSLADASQQRARHLVATVHEQARDWMDRAEERGRAALDEVVELRKKATERATQFKGQVEERSRELQRKARLRAEEIGMRSKMMIHEHPLEVLGGIAGAAFLAGVSLRIVRSHHVHRY